MCQNNSMPFEQVIQSLMQILEGQGYSAAVLARNRRISEVMRAFLRKNKSDSYTEDTGKAFVEFCKTHDVSTETRNNAVLFTQRLNAVLEGKKIPICLMPEEKYVLPDGLKILLDHYRADCMNRGLKESTTRINIQQSHLFLRHLFHNGCTGVDQINSKVVGTAVLAMERGCYIPRVKTFLRFLFDHGHTDKDFSYIVPGYRIPQPVPSVYSEDELSKIEEAALLGNPLGRRDYTIVLLASRLGLRSGDIAALTFDTINYDAGLIRITQQKTGMKMELPLLPEIKEAIASYISEERPVSDSPYIFLTPRAPYQHISAKAIGKRVAKALGRTGIDIGSRKRGAHSLRASLASSMVNDGIPYEAVRKTLGHSDLNSTKCYARLDLEQLRPYTLSPPKASGSFLEFLTGRRCVK